MDGAQVQLSDVHLSEGDFLVAFENTTLSANDFDHTAHVRAAFLTIQSYGFTRAIPVFCDALKKLTVRFGAVEKYHETITIAFLVLINERLSETPDIGWAEFCAGHGDVFSRHALDAYYTPEQLKSPNARRVFQLPLRRFAV